MKGNQLEKGICPYMTKGAWKFGCMGSPLKLHVAQERNPQLADSRGGGAPASLVDRQLSEHLLCVWPELRSENNTKTNVAWTHESPLSTL